MSKKILLIGILIMNAAPLMAGTFKDGEWLPGSCGSRQDPPAVDASSADNYNASINAIKEWQAGVKTYEACLVKEANADGALLAKSAKAEQDKLKATIDKINAELEAGRTSLQQSQSAAQQ